jgi:hypothetical protein
MEWSMLCPNWMVPERSEVEFPSVSSLNTTPRSPLIASAGTPPLWQDSWLKHIPLIGKTIVSGMNAGRYQTTLEANADFIAKDLEVGGGGGGGGEWVGKAVGVISAERG